MATIEIRLNRKKLIILMRISLTLFCGIIYYQYCKDLFDTSETYTYMFFIFVLFFIGWNVWVIRKLVINAPVLTLSESEIKLLVKNKIVAFAWKEITNWNIGDEGEDGTYLNVYAGKNKQKINVSSLDKRPEEIEKLIRAYMNASEK